MMRFTDIVGFAFLLLLQFQSGSSQSMDPRVNITETLPISSGSRVRGIVSQDVLLSCKVENLPNDLKVHWQRTTFDLSTGTIHERVVQISIDLDIVDNTKWSIEKPTPYTWRLRIRSLAYTDEGNYTCYVPLSDKMNRAESNRTVFAFAKPVILEDKSSSDTSAKEADTVTLTCNATGRPMPTVLWRREGYAVLPGGGTVFMGSELVLTNVDYTARGTYVCDSMNEVGEDIRYIQLSIIHGPKMSSEEESVGQAIGYTRTLLCYIDANPVPSTNPTDNQLYWSRGGVVVVSDARRTVVASVGAYGRLVFELVIHSVVREDYGTYTCTARNGVSTGALAIQLFETSTPQDDKGKIQSGSGAPPTTLSCLLAMCLCLLFATFNIYYI